MCKISGLFVVLVVVCVGIYILHLHVKAKSPKPQRCCFFASSALRAIRSISLLYLTKDEADTLIALTYWDLLKRRQVEISAFDYKKKWKMSWFPNIKRKNRPLQLFKVAFMLLFIFWLNYKQAKFIAELSRVINSNESPTAERSTHQRECFQVERSKNRIFRSTHKGSTNPDGCTSNPPQIRTPVFGLCGSALLGFSYNSWLCNALLYSHLQIRISVGYLTTRM